VLPSEPGLAKNEASRSIDVGRRTDDGSRKGGAEFSEPFEGCEPGAALVPVAGGEGHLRGLRGGEICHGERARQVSELGDDRWGDFAGVESPEEDAETF